MSLFPEKQMFQLCFLVWSKLLRAITAYDISSLWRDISAPSVHCLNLIFKMKFFSKPSTSVPRNLAFLCRSVLQMVRLKSVRQKDKSMLLRCSSIHFFKICYIAERLPESRVTCNILGVQLFCAAHCKALGHTGGYCDDKKVCRCR